MNTISKINVNGTDYKISLTDGIIDDVLMKDGNSVSTAIENKIDSSAISRVATTGSYNDLIDKPDLVECRDLKYAYRTVPEDGL